jgi:hypothetical protein
MAVLELGAVDLNYRAGIADQTFGCGFDEPVFPDPVGPRKRKLPIGRAGLDIPATNV